MARTLPARAAAVALSKTRTADRGRPPIPHKAPAGGTATLEAAIREESSRLKRFLKILGPGLITGASADDPSGIGTYVVAGASVGFGILWLAPILFPLMSAVQFICAKIGMVSGMGLAGVLRRHYPRPLLYAAVLGLLIANTINAGADLGAIAAAINMLLPIPIAWLIVPITALVLALQIVGSYRLIAVIFKWLSLSLFAYIASAVFAHPDPGSVVRGTLLPSLRLDATFLSTLVAVLGTTISPYLFFWQATQEVEEEVQMGRKSLQDRRGATDAELKYAAWDVNLGMLFSTLVMYFIMLATAATLFSAGRTSVGSAAEAAEALRPLAGDAAYVLLALGLIGTGFLGVPVLTGSAAYAVSEVFGWRFGLDLIPARAKQFYGMIIAATVVGMLLNFVGINPIDALFWSAVINGFLAPPLMVLVMLIANNGTLMQARTNGLALNVLGWLATAIMFAAASALVLTWQS